MLCIDNRNQIFEDNWRTDAFSLPMLEQNPQLDLDRCPHCGVDRPSLTEATHFATDNHVGHNHRWWVVYTCSRCGGAVLTASHHPHDTYGAAVVERYPTGLRVPDEIPERARAFLLQSQASLHAPAGAVMLAASAVDAMLKHKNFKTGNLCSRIDEAAKAHLITDEMRAWAHDVRLDANDQRHADDKIALPGEPDARRALEFALALAEYLFVLPTRVRRGREGKKAN